MRSVPGVLSLVLGIMVLACPVAMAGRNASGAMVVHTDDAHSWTVGVCEKFDDWVPQSCDSLNTRTDNDENTPALIWFIAAFPDTSDPGVTVVYFGVDHNLPEYYIEQHGFCGPDGTIEVPDGGWPDDTDAGNSVAFGSAVTSDSLFPFYYFSAYGFEDAYLGTAENPVGGYAAFVDDSNPPVLDEVANFGTVRWYAAGSNECSSQEEDGGGEGGDEGDGQDSEEEEEEEEDWDTDQWLDGDGERQWVRDCILVQLRKDLPMPPYGSASALGIPAFDALCRELDVVSMRRVVNLNDEACSKFPVGCRLVSLQFGAGTDELAAAWEFQQLSEVVWAGPNHVSPGEVFSTPPTYPEENQDDGNAFLQQWHLVWNNDATSCLEDDEPDSCCTDCDIGVDTAWQYTRGDANVFVAFFDLGADMQHPDLFDVYLVNWAEDDGDGLVELCPADPDSGDINGVDEDSSGIADDILFGWCGGRLQGRTWRHGQTPHGTSVAGILGAITNNGTGVASVAGGNGKNDPGARLIQFSWEQYLVEADQVASFYDARDYGARVYSSSARWMFTSSSVDSALAELADSMLFIQAVGNNGETPMESAFARDSRVMAVGGYECEFGGRWVAPDGYGYGGSDYGPELSVMGPTDDPTVYEEAYEHMVYASTSPATDEYLCNPDSVEDAIDCFGCTSAAAPVVASVAALVFSYSDEHGLGLTPSQVRTVIERTAEDIQCDPDSIGLPGCDCSNPHDTCAVRLLGRDQYTGYGRVDAGRALTLPIAILDPVSSPHGPWIIPGDTLRLSWEAFDINTENDTPVADSARFDLHFLVLDEGIDDGWRTIADSLSPDTRSYDWAIPPSPDSLTDETGDIRIRLRVVDSGGYTNQDYSDVFRFVHPSTVDGTPTAPLVAVLGVAPNPASSGARIRYALREVMLVRIRIFDVSGRLVRSLANGEQAPGERSLDWDGFDDSGHRAASGLYFIQFDLGSQTRTSRLVRIR